MVNMHQVRQAVLGRSGRPCLNCRRVIRSA
jgi:hypothetical protein